MQKRTFYNILIFIVFVGAAALYFRNGIYLHDDFAMSFFYNNSLLHTIINADHGRYFSSIVMKLVADTLSIIQNIHPQDNFLGFTFKGINFAVLFYLMAKLFELKENKTNKEKYKFPTNPVVFVLILFFGLYFAAIRGFSTINHYNQNFGYIFNLLFFIPAFIVIGNSFLNGKLPEKKYLPLNCFLFLILGLSAHFNIITMWGVLFAIFVYEAFEHKNNIKKFFNTICNSSVVLPVISFMLGTIASFTSRHFRYLLFNVRHPEGEWIPSVIASLSDFTYQWARIVFKQNVLTHIILLALLFSLLVIRHTGRVEKYKKIFLGLSLVFGAAFFNYTLIICGTTYYDGESYWLASPELKLITDYFFLMAMIIIMSVITELYKNKFLPAILSAMICISTFLTVLPDYENNYSYYKAKRKALYQAEKGMLFLINRGMTDKISYPLGMPVEDWVFDMGAYEDNFYYIYGMHTIKDYDLIPEDEYLKRMKALGMNISTEEYANPKFTDLLKYKKKSAGK